jgi:hypothetical protein
MATRQRQERSDLFPNESSATTSSSAADGVDTGSSKDAIISEEQRMAMAYQMLMAALQRLGSAATESSGTSATA